MELGLTFPLQGFLKRKPPAYGAEPDRRFCWDLHVIALGGRPSLLAVHCHSRDAFVRWDAAPCQWADLPGLFREGLEESLAAAGFSPRQAEAYLKQGGKPFLTRTHGRREVAFLNRAWEEGLALDLCLDRGRQAQPLLDQEVNARPCRCAGVPGVGTGRERMAALLAEMEAGPGDLPPPAGQREKEGSP